MINPYKILGVHRESSQEEIKANYYILMKQAHPDVVTGTAPNPPEDIIAAYQIIKDKNFLRQHMQELQVLGIRCGVCSGKGYKAKQRGITERTLTACGECGGQGFTPKE